MFSLPYAVSDKASSFMNIHQSVGAKQCTACYPYMQNYA